MTIGIRLRGAALVVAAVLAMAMPASAEARARTILFVGNSFTYAAYSPVRRYRAGTVTDLNREGIGGVPALFKLFTQEAGLDYAVSLETAGGKDLEYHYDRKRELIDRAWDVVVLQGFSTLDRDRPGDPALHVRYAGLLAAMFHDRNPGVRVELTSTWSRADLTYKPEGHWYGKPITAMATDLRAASDLALASSKQIDAVVPVGEAWNRAIAEKIADPNPYDGIGFGQIDLWTYDQYHGSMYGYYLEALVIFGKVTGLDPRLLGDKEQAADDLGISPAVAAALRQVAFEQLQIETSARP